MKPVIEMLSLSLLKTVILIAGEETVTSQPEIKSPILSRIFDNVFEKINWNSTGEKRMSK